jgi:hypothetical protein
MEIVKGFWLTPRSYLSLVSLLDGVVGIGIDLDAHSVAGASFTVAFLSVLVPYMYTALQV